MAYVTVAEAKEFAGLSEESNLRVRTLVNLADRAVAYHAPYPTQSEAETDDEFATRETDYKARAKDATLFIFQYLYDTKGFISGEKVLDTQITYTTDSGVIAAVASNMGDFFTVSTSRAFRTRSLERS